MWQMYEPMLRADFKLFDEYLPSVSQQQAREEPFGCQMRLFWGRQDRRVTGDMVQVRGG
jgi:surfactin synthase thioesterase subunit